MGRTFFQRPPAGYRAVRGMLITQVQEGLRTHGIDPGPSDGLFGDQTARALATYQKAVDLPPSGAVDAETWQLLVSPQPPGLRERCLQVTADFEDHGFARVIGNVDGAGLTWGIIGFTLASGSLQRG